MKPPADFANFASLDIRVGKIIQVEAGKTNKPTWRLTIDFGPEIGPKISCGGYRNYTMGELLNKLVIAVVNLPTKKMGPETSEVLVLGATGANSEPIYLTSQADVPLGSQIF